MVTGTLGLPGIRRLTIAIRSAAPAVGVLAAGRAAAAGAGGIEIAVILFGVGGLLLSGGVALLNHSLVE